MRSFKASVGLQSIRFSLGPLGPSTDGKSEQPAMSRIISQFMINPDYL